MLAQDVIDLTREALVNAMILSAPVLCVALLTGLLVGILQSLTQVQDQTVSTVPRLLAVLAALAISLPWMVDRMVDYSHALFQQIPATIVGG